MYDKQYVQVWWSSFTGLILIAITQASAVASDSTELPEFTAVGKRPSSSILGQVEDTKTCTYKALDRRIHCLKGEKDDTDYLAGSVLKPAFPRFQPLQTGFVTIDSSQTYGFVNPETMQSSGGETTVCKLALKMAISESEYVWVWFDEIRFEGLRHHALIDDNGNGFYDRKVSGLWTGEVSGSRKWWTSDPFDGRYSEALRTYTIRPEFGRQGGRSRACLPSDTRVVTLLRPS